MERDRRPGPCGRGIEGKRIKTDSGPTNFGETTRGHHDGQPKTDFKHQTAERFAEEIVTKLEDGRVKNQFGKLGLVCPPLFLGVLRNKLSSPLAQLVTLELDKDYTHIKLKDISAALECRIDFAEVICWFLGDQLDRRPIRFPRSKTSLGRFPQTAEIQGQICRRILLPFGTGNASLSHRANFPSSQKELAMWFWIILILLIVILVGSVPAYPYSRGWGYGPSGGRGFSWRFCCCCYCSG